MKILLATGIYPPDIGGPAQYAKNLAEEFKKIGHQVQVLTYNWEKKMPTVIRHLWFFLRVIWSLPGVDFILALDTFSVGFPATLAAVIFGKKVIIRVGGDFLWEGYVERTGDLVLLREFYLTRLAKLNYKERLIFALIRWEFRHCHTVAFTTVWQRDIFYQPYNLAISRTAIIENSLTLPARDYFANLETQRLKTFFAGSRSLKLKNLDLLHRAFSIVNRTRPDLILDIKAVFPDTLSKSWDNIYAIVVPSISDISPNLVLEGIAYGKPFILSKETGLYNKFKDVVGLWIDPHSVEDLVQKILFLADRDNYQRQREIIRSLPKSLARPWSQLASEFINLIK